jgi:endoglucanase
VRISKTLNLGKQYTWYGIVLLVVECMGATTVVIYGINLLFNPVHETFPDDDRQPGCPKVRLLSSIDFG